jgi:D-beta-D-heptose 7-phosphate kinase/D-beta-D-heptose 1-phosphate adenosyltransferase
VGRVLSRDELARAIGEDRRAGRRIVFTNGCFDLLHAGHVRYLREARSLGDRLVVGVNTDASIRRLGKGEDRPIVAERERIEVLAALEMVDYATLFDEDTPLELVRLVLPDVLAKGGDWTPETVVGADVVRARGGEVAIIPYHPGLSTTSIVDRIRGGAG